MGILLTSIEAGLVTDVVMHSKLLGPLLAAVLQPPPLDPSPPSVPGQPHHHPTPTSTTPATADTTTTSTPTGSSAQPSVFAKGMADAGLEAELGQGPASGSVDDFVDMDSLMSALEDNGFSGTDNKAFFSHFWCRVGCGTVCACICAWVLT